MMLRAGLGMICAGFQATKFQVERAAASEIFMLVQMETDGDLRISM
jgi:hypothetical protein